MLAPRQLNVKPSIEDTDSESEAFWDVQGDYEKPEKEMEFPLIPLGKVPTRKESMNNLRINTYTSSDLHERYMSDEEEPSPSPHSETSNYEEELKHKAPAASTTEVAEPVIYEEYTAEIAVAVPIMAIGRPKLVDITNHAPMHKRKRIEKPMLSRSAVKNAASRIPTSTDENAPSVVAKATTVATPENHIPKREDSLPNPAPESWLPDDVTVVAEEDDLYFPDLELRNPPTYNDYDPYSLDPPRLSPRNSYTSTTRKPGSVTRARNNPHPPIAMNNGWKGITRSLSMAKKQTLHRGDQQITKKPKMVARPANERKPCMLPAFPLAENKVES